MLPAPHFSSERQSQFGESHGLRCCSSGRIGAMSDYTRGAPANQLDDGIGDTLVLGPRGIKHAPLRAHMSNPYCWCWSIRSSNRFVIVILA